MGMMLDNHTIALISAMKRLGGEIKIGMDEMHQIDRDPGRYSFFIFQEPGRQTWTFQLIDRDAPVEETLTVVDDMLALRTPLTDICPRCGRTDPNHITCEDC